jgi:NADH-quinone oxidoreductase subunit G
MDDVAHDPVLNVSERGDRAVIGKFDGADLTHPWASNVVDLCPVGALLSKDFLNKARAWELDRSASICPNCTQGCNSIIETRDNQVVRMRPRPNQDVNSYFMCDTGRLDYRWINRTDRLELPMVQKNGALTPVDWEAALQATAGALRGKRVTVLASPMLSNESLFLLSRLGGRGIFRVAQGPEAPLEGVPDLALRADRAANVRGAEEMGFTRASSLSGVAAGDVVVIADDDLDGLDPASLGSATLIVMGTTLPASIANRVAVALPTTNFAEEEGTFTNLRGRVQRYLQAKAAPGLARPMWYALTDLLALLGQPAAYFLASEVFDAMVAAKPSFAGMAYDTLGLRGTSLPEGSVAGRSA